MTMSSRMIAILLTAIIVVSRSDISYTFEVRDSAVKTWTGWAYFDFSLFGDGRMQVKWDEGFLNQ